MEKVVQLFQSPEEADAATAAYWATQTPEQRLEHMVSIRHQWVKEDERRIPRTYQLLEVA
jgi:hypothetical protein